MSARQTVFTIAPHAPFLTTLARAVLDGTVLGDWPRTGPFWLSDVTIVLPTQRARRSLAEAFLAEGAVLLPDIRTFGGEAADEEPFLPPIEAPVPLPAISPLERRLVLARLVTAWAATVDGAQAFANPPNDAEMLALAESLGQLLDDLTIEGVDVAGLRDIAPDSLAENWQQTLRFVDLVADQWPAILAGRGRADAAAARNERLRRQAAAAELLFGDRPVIAAGSTGSIPATAALLAAIRKLERGVIVLPGLDTSIDPQGHDRLLDPDRSPHGHAQYGLAQLVRHLGQRIDQVTELAPAGTGRTDIGRAALALAEDTEHWSARRRELGDAAIAQAFAGVTTLLARSEDEEARAIALTARNGLAAGQTVGIVSPDRNLARRIAAELRRYGVDIDDGAGVPLFQSPAGRLARQIVTLCAESQNPVDVVALLSERWISLGLDRTELRRRAKLLDTVVLRGQAIRPGFAGLRDAVAARLLPDIRGRRVPEAQGPLLIDLIDRLEAAVAPVTALVHAGRFTAAGLGSALLQAEAAITDSDEAVPGRQQFIAWAAALMAMPDEGPRLLPRGLDGLLYQLMAGIDVRNPRPERDDIVIWGQLEARLQNPGLMILAGLNEDIWPHTADPGPWLSRGMRLKAGLEPPERRQGQAAHDFAMALGNANVVLALSERRGTGPAIASRLVQRLQAFIGEDQAKLLRARGDAVIRQAARLDAIAGPPRPAVRPAPTPPVALRPRRLSVTEIETLFRSPYDIYARHVLRLNPLEALGEEPGARERGNLIHDAFANFVDAGYDVRDPASLDHLKALAQTGFAALDAIGERRDIWLRRFDDSARQFLAFEAEREDDIAERRAEIEGVWEFANGFRLTGRADRVDGLVDGSLAIIDFKTGGVPSPGTMKAFEAPQLLLEAQMAAVGAMKGIAPAPTSALTYIKIGLGPEKFEVKEFSLPEGHDLMSAAAEITARMERHVAAFLFGDLAMMARLKPDTTKRFPGNYDHLARTDEWTLAAGEEGEG